MIDIHRTSAAAYLVRVDGDVFRFEATNKALLAHELFLRTFHPGLTPADIFPPDLAEVLTECYRECCRTRQAHTYESDAVFPNQGKRWLTTLIPVVDETDTVTSIVAICQDVVEKPRERKGGIDVDTPSQALGAIGGCFWVFEIATKHFEMSRSLAELLGGPGHPPLGIAEYASFIHADDIGRVELVTPPDNSSSVEFRIITHDGRTRWLQSNRRAVRDADGSPVRIVGLVLDVTARKTAMRTLETQASTDFLTGLLNRRVFLKTARRKLAARRRKAVGLGLLLIDIDDFKTINDRHGHLAGDDLLRQVARRLSRATRSADLLARVGGDEFAVLYEGDDAATVLEARIERAFAKPFHVGDATTFVGVSFGSTSRRAEDLTIDHLFARADAALYAFKDARRRITA